MKIKIDKNIDTAFKICESALKVLDIKIDKIDYNKGYILASTKSGWLSWGENIEIRIDSNSLVSTSIQISSKAKAQLITWGKNDKNIREIGETIKKIGKSTR